MNATSSAADTLFANWQALRAAEPGLRARELAERLNASEGEIVAARAGRDLGVTRLDSRFRAMIEAMPAIGRVMCLTRNDDVVHERKGAFLGVDLNDWGGVVLGPDIDLRIFFSEWKAGFLVEEEAHGRALRSLQFFDKAGIAVHKIYVQPETDLAAFDALVTAHRAEDQSPGLVVEACAPKPQMLPVADSVDVASFRQGWAEMTDTHQFFGLLKAHGLTRYQALHLAEERFARRIGKDALERVLNGAAKSGQPIMVFVGNPGCIQIHTGPVKTIKVMGDWLNVLDPDFNLHIRADRIAEVWAVRKPTEDGIVTALEILDQDGNHFLQLFGERKPGKPEREDWRALVQAVSEPELSAA